MTRVTDHVEIKAYNCLCYLSTKHFFCSGINKIRRFNCTKTPCSVVKSKYISPICKLPLNSFLTLLNNRHSQIIHDHQLLIKQQQQQMLAAATTPNKGHHNAQGSFSHFNTSHVPHQHAYSHSYSHTNPRDHNL